jgi:hypothetical protein
MAENARELGLDYEPVQELKMYEDWYDSSSCGHCGMVNGHRPECRHNYKTPAQPAPVQEPVAWMSASRFEELRKGFTVVTTLTKQRAFEDDIAIYTTPPNVATPLDETASLAAPAPEERKRQSAPDPKDRRSAWVHVTPWRGLTDEEIKTVIAKIDPNEHYLPNALRQLSLAIEAKLKEKNCD